MKKIFLGIAVLALTSFTMASAPGSNPIERIGGNSAYEIQAYLTILDGMTYRVFISRSKSGGYDNEMVVVNIDKERLEIENLKLENEKLEFEISKLKR